MSQYSSESLTISVHKPLVRGGGFLFDWRINIDSWQHESRALGGYWSARAGQQDNLRRAEEWLDEGLGRHVEVYDEGGDIVWEGFVNSVSLDVGGLNVTRGPLLSVANKVKLVYSGIDTTNGGYGTRAETSYVEDSDSQDAYGILTKILSSGGVTQTNAEQLRDSYLAEYKLPETTSRFVLNNRGGVRLTVDLLGYVHWLTVYPYASATTGTQNLSVKLAAVLDADPNSFFDSSNASLATNTLAVAAFENDDPTAWDAIKALTAQGDASENRYTFGVYGGRRAVYEAAPTTYAYQRRLSSQGEIETPVGGRVRPWAVRPGRWLFFSDFLIGRTQPAALRDDPRALFIERVSFSLPRGLEVDGSKVSTLEQKIARLGLMGIGA